MSRPQIVLNNLTFILTNNRILFKNLNLTFMPKKIGIVGKNGIGKSVLLKIITGNLKASSGSVKITGEIAYLPQDLTSFANATIAEIFAVTEKLAALERIYQGSINENDFALVGDDWKVKENLQHHLAKFGFDNLDLGRTLASFSGGEQTRIWLTKLFFNVRDFIILDEPTNNLDSEMRSFLYKAINDYAGGVIVVSHDRTLLNSMQEIIELTSLGTNVYGGNFEFYLQQKNLEEAAKLHKLEVCESELRLAEKSMQKNREKIEQRCAQGKKLRIKGDQPKMLLDAMQDKSEHTQKTLKERSEKAINLKHKQLQAMQEKIELNEKINISLPKTKVPNNKMVLTIENMSFCYSKKEPLINNFSLEIIGPERVALTGKNGSGKTTIIKLILGKLTPQLGQIKIGISKMVYLDQHLSILNPNLTIFENCKQINPEATDNEIYRVLAQFLFRNVTAHKIVSTLSGGEKIRAALAAVFSSHLPPQLIILDEPTNHLDLASIESLEMALNCYEGAILVVSHDEAFLKNIKITNNVMTC